MFFSNKTSWTKHKREQIENRGYHPAACLLLPLSSGNRVKTKANTGAPVKSPRRETGPQTLQLFPVALGRVWDEQAEPDDGVFGVTAQCVVPIREVDPGGKGQGGIEPHPELKGKSDRRQEKIESIHVNLFQTHTKILV